MMIAYKKSNPQIYSSGHFRGTVIMTSQLLTVQNDNESRCDLGGIGNVSQHLTRLSPLGNATAFSFRTIGDYLAKHKNK